MRPETVDRVHDLAEKAHKNMTSGLVDLGEIRRALRDADKSLSALSEHKVASATAVGAILYLTQEDKGIAVPVSEQAKAVVSPPSSSGNGGAAAKLGLILAVAGLCSASIGSAHPEVLPVATKPKPEPVLPVSPYDLGMTKLRGGEFALAANLFYEASHLRGADQNECMGRRAECLFRLADYPAVLAACDELEGVRPNAGKAAFWRGAVYAARGDKDKAVEWYTRAVDRNPDDVVARHELAAILSPSTTKKGK